MRSLSKSQWVRSQVSLTPVHLETTQLSAILPSFLPLWECVHCTKKRSPNKLMIYSIIILFLSGLKGSFRMPLYLACPNATYFLQRMIKFSPTNTVIAGRIRSEAL